MTDSSEPLSTTTGSLTHSATSFAACTSETSEIKHQGRRVVETWVRGEPVSPD